jgi:hypothetical protein
MKLFELETEIRVVEAALNEYAEGNDGEVTEFPDLGKLIDMKAERTRKLLGLGCLVKEIEAEAEAIKIEAAKLKARSDARFNHAERLREFITRNLEREEKLSDARVAFSWRKSEAVVLAPELNPESLPVNFRRVKVDADRTAIKEALKAGETVDGATLEKRINLQIK